MEREKIIFLRNFFLRAFVVGVLFALFYWIATVALWHTYAPWLVERFNMDEKELGLFLPRARAGAPLEREESLTCTAELLPAHSPNEQ
jgi:hypothetical protein